MSYYEGLPIYKGAMDVVVLVEAATQRFAKRHKYTLGSRLLDTATDCAVLVARANQRAGRLQSLERLCVRVADLKVLLHVGKEVQAFASFQHFAQVMEQVVNVSKQAEAWRAHVRRADAHDPAGSGPRSRPEPISGAAPARGRSR